MNTYYLPDDAVNHYLEDLAKRLKRSGVPPLWIAIGSSGLVVAKQLIAVAADLADQISWLNIDFDRNMGDIVLPPDEELGAAITGEHVLLLDGSVHSGKTLLRTLEAMTRHGAAAVTSYAIVVRRGACVIPNYFGLLIGDHDRALFLRQEYPNHRLASLGVYRKLLESDLGRSMVKTGEDFIDKFSWSDLWYELHIDPRRHTYVYQVGSDIRGFVSFRVSSADTILIDTIAVDRGGQRQGIGGHLMRWVENYARHSGCTQLSLWAVESREKWYEGMGHRATGERLDLDGCTFLLMLKKILYNLPDENSEGVGS